MHLDRIPLTDLARAHQVVGAAVGASIRGERSVSVTGVANLRTGAAVEPDTAFMAGSVTKAMTASIVAVLTAEGRVALDEPVRSYVPEFAVADPDAGASITVRQLLTHTSGFDGDLWSDTGEGDEAIGRLVASLHGRILLHPPGRGFSYNNAAYSVLGRVVEQVTGTTFEQAVRSYVAEPAGAQLTTDVRKVLAGRFAVGHGRNADGAPEPVETVIGPAGLAPAGSRTWATVEDLLAFGELHLGRGDPALHPALVAMRAPQVAVPDPDNGGTMALGMFLEDRWGTPVVFHDGGVNGQSAYLRILPENDTVLVVACTGGVPQRFHRAAFAAMATELGHRAPSGSEPDLGRTVEAGRYVGTYRATGTAAEVTRGPDGLRIALTWGADQTAPHRGPEGPLLPVDDRVFLTPIDGRNFVIVFPPADEPCDHLLAGLRRLPRST